VRFHSRKRSSLAEQLGAKRLGFGRVAEIHYLIANALGGDATPLRNRSGADVSMKS
jgi:hypothetical protein